MQPMPMPGYHPQHPMYYRHASPHMMAAGPRGPLPGRGPHPRHPAQAVVVQPKVKNTDKDGKNGQKNAAGRQLVYVPRVPAAQMYPQLYYYPQVPGGMPYYYPDDPRLMMGPQYLPHYPVPQQMHVPGMYPMPRPMLAESLVDIEDKRRSATSSPNLSNSPSSSPGMAGQPIHLLPTARHVPHHLLPGRSVTPTGSSRSSTPQRSESPRGYTHGLEFEQNASQRIEAEYVKSSSPSLDLQEVRESANSPLARVIMQKTSKMDMSILAQQSMAFEELKNMEREGPPTAMESKPRRTHGLKLNMHNSTTGFSRQYSEDLETPTEIKNLVRMLDEPLEEHDESIDDDETLEEYASGHRASFASRVKSRSNSRQLHLKIPSLDDSTEEHSELSPSSDPSDGLPTYAGVLRRRLPSELGDLDTSLQMIEPKTPHTPAGFVTPSDEVMDTDPLGILRNLNINASESQKQYKYFS